MDLTVTDMAAHYLLEASEVIIDSSIILSDYMVVSVMRYE
jgi:hypothetical protein